MTSLRTLYTLLLACLTSSAFAAQEQPAPKGELEPAFNHEVPEHWKKGQAGWDGEPDSPYRYPDAPTRFMASHLSLIPRGPFQGQLLTWNHMRVMLGEQYWAIVDPVNKKFLNYSMPSGPDDEDIFCSGHAWTKDGDLFVAGGNKDVNGWITASKKTYRFVPTNEAGKAMWVREPDMTLPRWYPTVTAMGSDAQGNDHMLVSGGTRATEGRTPFKSYETFNPSGAPGSGSWQRNPREPKGGVFPCPGNLKRAYQFGIYPRVHLLSDGSLFFAGMSGLSYRLTHFDISAKNAPHWDVQPVNPFISKVYPSSILLPNLGGSSGPNLNRVMRMGGADVKVVKHVPQAPPYVDGPPFAVATGLSEWIQADLPESSADWNWNESEALSFPRARPNATLLPDGSVLVSGGKLDTEVEINCGVPVLPLEILDVASMTWRTDVSASVRRGYHSSVALLPDGRVLLGGGEAREMDYEIYRPPYLTDGSARPTILGQAPPGEAWAWGYAQEVSVSFALKAGVQVEKGVLMAPASTTHHFDMHQRYVELDLVEDGATPVEDQSSSIQFTTPPNSNHAPKGYYMLFLITGKQGQASSGTPSMAAWVKLD